MIKVVTFTQEHVEAELNKLYKEGWKIISSSSAVKEEKVRNHTVYNVVRMNIFYLTYTLEKPDEVTSPIYKSSKEKLESRFDTFITHMSKNFNNPTEYTLSYLYEFWKIDSGDENISQLDFQNLLDNHSEKNHEKYLIIYDSHQGICVLFHKLTDEAPSVIFEVSNAPDKEKVIKEIIEAEKKDIEKYLLTKRQEGRDAQANRAVKGAKYSLMPEYKSDGLYNGYKEMYPNTKLGSNDLARYVADIAVSTGYIWATRAHDVWNYTFQFRG